MYHKVKIVDIFYHQADSVIELEFEDFDKDLIEFQKVERGRRQTYFNPIEEYQEAAEAGALRFATNAEKAHMKAKQGESFKKDPIARAMLEGSKKPTKIVYTKDLSIITQYGVTRSKETISIPSELDIENSEQILGIISCLVGGENNRSIERSENNPDQTKLV